MKSLQFVDHSIYSKFYDADGNSLVIYSDINKLEEELLTKAPEDRKLILSFTNAVRKFSKLDITSEKANELFTFKDNLKMFTKILPYIFIFNKWLKISASDFAKKFKNPLVKKAFEYLFTPSSSCLFLIITLGWFDKKSAGYPIGGSLNFSKKIEETFLKLGGKISYKSKVNKILYEQENSKYKAVGIELEDGSKHLSDIVISAADGHFTLFNMLDGKFLTNQIKDFYANKKTFSSLIQIAYGISKEISTDCHSNNYLIKNPINIDDQTNADAFSVRILNFDPTLAPSGKTLITVTFETYSYEYWVNLKNNNPRKYKEEKDRIAKETLNLLEEKIGNIKDYVEMTDVSTPSTIIRYTNNWKGSFEGWEITPEVGLKQISKTLPDLLSFYMIGQWVVPGGGLPGCLLTGRDVAQIICHNDNVDFNPKLNKGKI